MTNHHSHLGELIHQQNDEQGPITVYQNYNLRYLTFGNQVEQSCMSLEYPHRLEHAYTQAMMLSLLFKQDIRHAALLGFGGGSLARALYHARPKLKVDAVEYRPMVIDIAKRFFELPDHKHFTLHTVDAADFIINCRQQFDLVFTDLYLPEGVHQLQHNHDFLQQCMQQLSANGLLIVNQWSNDFKQVQLAHQVLRESCNGMLLNLHVHGGNNIAFAFKDDFPDLKRKIFFEDARKLGLKLNIPLQKLARNFWQENVQQLNVSRYSRN